MNLIKTLLDILKPDQYNKFEEILIDDISAILTKHYKTISKFTLENTVKTWIVDKSKPIQLNSVNVIEIKVYKDLPVYKYKILIIILQENSVITLKSNPKQINPNFLDKQILEQLEETSECILLFK